MQGKLSTKSKVIYTVRPRSQIYRKKIKQERASTPQRWSRRIRSLPPIPINVLAPHRNTRKRSLLYKREKVVTSHSERGREKAHTSKVRKEKRNNVSANKNHLDHKLDSVEVVRIVPVVVFVKNPSEANLRSIPKEIRVHLNGKSTCKMFAQNLNARIRKKIKKEHLDLERKQSRKIKTSQPHPVSAVTSRKRYASRRDSSM